ncbi:Uncharacterised protein [Enterobacter cloacae]|nr:Uncharacterised protein [Enterobacter cloacae]
MTSVSPAMYPLLTQASAEGVVLKARAIAGKATLAINMFIKSRKKPSRKTTAILLRYVMEVPPVRWRIVSARTLRINATKHDILSTLF